MADYIIMNFMQIRTRLLLAFLTAAACLFAADDPYGEAIYQKHCAMCHDKGGDTRVPPRATLQQMSASAITRALTVGAMRDVGKGLDSGEIRGIATFLGKGENLTVVTDRMTNRCASAATANAAPAAWAGWGGVTNSRFQDAAAAGLSANDVPKLKLKWAFALPDVISMRSQPAVFDGKVIVGGVDAVYAINAKTGCLYWATSLAAPVRSGVAIVGGPNRTLAVFGDLSGHLRALDANTGQPVWQVEADEHPATMVTSTPAVHNGRLYFGVSSYEESRSLARDYVCCNFRGSVQAVDAATGKVIWKTYMVTETAKPGKNTKRGAKTMGPSGAGVWSSPTLDLERNIIYVTTGDNYSDPTTNMSDAVVALAIDSGKILWSKQMTASDAFNSTCALPDKANCPDSDGPDFDFGSSSILVKLASGKRVLVLPQKSGVVHGVDPDQQGKTLWQSRAGDGGTLGGIQWGAASDGNRVYAALSDIRFTARTASGRTPDPAKGGGMFAFRVDNGERMWMTPPPGCGDRSPCSPAQSGAVSAISGVVFSGSNDGHLRGYSTADGKIIWDFDTAREYQTVNGVPGKGGALDAGGPVIAGGMLFVNSGYGQWGGMPGNVLLAFSVDGD